MPFYHKLGKIPRLKHTTFFKEDGKSLYREELVSSKGFSGVYSHKYHLHMPTSLKSIKEISVMDDYAWPEAPLSYYHFYTDDCKASGDFIRSRRAFLYNNDCVMLTAKVTEDTEDYYRNAHSAEYLFVHRGRGRLLSDFGQIPFESGDQFIIPRATTYQVKFDDFEDNKLLIVESSTAYEIPNHFHNNYGQFEEHAPYCERDFKLPEYFEPSDERGDFRIIVKSGDRWFEQIAPHHPFGVVGWDGYLYPYGFNIKDYHPKVGRIHLPPPTHLAFNTQSFVICNFVPRPFDFHPDAIPAPYFHSNIDSDEVLYYVDGDFMSRKGVRNGSITLHPGGMPHGPQPGKTEESVGAKETNEWAVMVDTFAPLLPTRHVKDVLDPEYARSWLE